MSKLQEYLEMALETRDGVEGNWFNISEITALPGIKRLNSIGWELSSSDRQLKNGTLMFKSNKSGNKNQFSITSNGFVRRHTGRRNQFSNTDEHYQINRNFMYGQEVTNIEHLEKLIDFLADFLEKNKRHN